MLLMRVQMLPINVRAATVRRRRLPLVCCMFLKEYRPGPLEVALSGKEGARTYLRAGSRRGW